MKKITSWTSLFLFLFLLSCSRQEDSKSTKVAPAVPDEMTKEYELKAGELQSVADFGEIKYNEVKILNLKIKNTGDEIITGPAVSETPDFSIIYQNTCTNIKLNQFCSVRVQIDARGKPAGTYNGSIALDSVIIPVTAKIKMSPGEENPLTNLKMSINGSPVELINFGTLDQSQTVMKTLTLTNEGNIKQNHTFAITGSGYSIAYDACSNKDLLPQKNCIIKIAFSARGLTGLQGGSLTFGSATVNLSSEVLTAQQASEQRSNLVFLYNNNQFSATVPMDVGNVVKGENYLYPVYLKNTGTAPALIDAATLTNSQIVVAHSTCREVLPNQTCLLKLGLHPTGLGSVTANLQVQQGALQKLGAIKFKSFPKVQTACTVPNSAEAGIVIANVAAVSGNLPDCMVTACSNNHLVAQDGKSCSLPTTALIGTNKTEATQLGSYFPIQLNYKALVAANNGDYSDVVYSIVSQNLGTGEFSCAANNPTNCIYIPSSLGDFSIIIKGKRTSTGEEATSRVDISVFGSDNVPEFATPGKIYISLKQGTTLDFNLVTATSGSDLIRYEVDQFPAVGQLSHCLNLTFADNANTDLSCKYLASGNLFSTSFTYKAINTVNNKFSIKEVQINILDSDNILDVYPSKWASLALNDAGFVFGRGSNESRVFGIDQDYKATNFVFESMNAIKVPLNSKVSKLWVKGNSAIAKLDNGQYWAWGQNRRSRMGIQNYNPSGDIIYKPQRVTLLDNKDFLQITMNENSACGMTSFGEVYCWGSNEFSELGDNSTTPSYGDAQTLRKINFGVKSAAQESAAAWDTNTSEYVLGANGSATRMQNISSWQTFLKSSNKRLIGDFEVTYTALDTDFNYGWFVGVSKNNGYEDGSQLAGFNASSTTMMRTYYSSSDRTQITLVPGLNTFKIKRIGSAIKFILNNVEVEQFASYGTQDVYPAVRLNGKIVSATVFGFHAKVASFLAESSVRANTHCAIIENESYCWGLNSNGQLGLGRTSVQLPSSYVPQKVLLNESVKKIAIGASFNCAITNADRVKCWGSNSLGQLGYGDTVDRGITEADMNSLPYVNLGLDGSNQPLKSREIYIGAGGDSLCSIFMDYRVKCWGKNDLGQLGNGTITNRGSQASHMGNNLPYLKNVNNIDLVGAYLRTSGEEDFCLRSNVDTKVYCWGNNQFSAVSPIFPNTPSIPREYLINPGDTAPFLVAGSQIAKTFTTNQEQSKTLASISPTNFKDLYSPDDAVLYFFDESSNVNVLTGVVYDSVNPSLVAGRLDLGCLGGISRNQLNTCNFTPAIGYTGTFVLKYKACSQNLKCSDQLITISSRVTDPNKPYFQVAGTSQTINLKRFESKSFSISAPADPQGRYVVIYIAENSARKNMYNYVELFTDDGKVAGIFDQSCFTQWNQNATPSQYSHNMSQVNCTFYPKESFNSTATLKYVLKNNAGFTSEVRSVVFNVQGGYQKVLHGIGYTDAYYKYTKFKRYPEQYGPNTFYGGLYLALGASDNGVYANFWQSRDMHPVAVYHPVINDLDPTKGYTGANNSVTDVISNVNFISGKRDDFCAITGVNNNVMCWSNNYDQQNSGQINPNFPNPYYYNTEPYHPRYIGKPDLSGLLSQVTHAEAGDKFGCAIAGANKSVYCWGKEVKGCGATFSPGVPCNVISDSDVQLTNAKSLSVGPYTACAVVTESSVDKLYCWGYKIDAEGAGSVSRGYDPNNSSNYNLKAKVITTVPNPIKVRVAESYACASSSNNKLYCFGINGSYGNLGAGLPFDSRTYDANPVKYAGNDLLVNPQLFDLASYSYSNDTACAIGADTNLYCWGYFSHQKLMNMQAGQQLTSAQKLTLSEISPIKKISVIENRICLNTTDNKLKCWGYDDYGQLGSVYGGWISYAEADYVKNEPNGAYSVVTDFAQTNALTYLISPQLIENHEYYQQGSLATQVAEGGTSTIQLTPSLDGNDEIVIMRKPQYGYLNEGNTLNSLVYTSTYNNTNVQGESMFDYITYYKVSDPSKLYKYVFETTVVNNPPVAKDFEDYAFVGTDRYLGNSYLGSEPEGTPYAFKFVTQPTKGVLTCYPYAGFPADYNQYCYYKPNAGTVGQEDSFTFKVSDNNSESEVKTVKFRILDQNALTAKSLYQELNILSYYSTSFEGTRAYSPQGEANGISIISGLVNDGGIYKVKDNQDNTLGTMTNGCFLSGSVSTYSCTFNPIKGISGTASIQYRLTQSGKQTEVIEIKINIGNNLSNLLYSVGNVSSGYAASGNYQTNSYLYRLQGGTNPSIASLDPYPVPQISRGILTYPGGGSFQAGLNGKDVLTGVTRLVQNTDGSEGYLAFVGNEMYIYGSVNPTAMGMHGYNYGGWGYWKMFFSDNQPLVNVHDGAIGSTQGCAIYGAERKLACWGRTRYEQISQNEILRSGCGPKDSLTKRGYACKIVKPDQSELMNVSSVATKNNTTCAIVTENNKGQLYCWGFRFDGNGVESRTESNRNHNTNYATKVAGYESEDVKSINLQDNRACATLASGKMSCFGYSSSYVGAKNRTDLHSKYLGKTDFIVDATVTGTDLGLRQIVDTRVVIEVPVNTADNSGINLTNWSVSNEDESNVAIALGTDRVVGGLVYKSIIITLNNDKPYEVSFSKEGYEYSGSVSMVAVKPQTAMSTGYVYCIQGSNDQYYCWGYDQGKSLVQTAAENFSSAEAVKIPWMSAIEPHKQMKLSQSGYNMCLINMDDEVKCWGYVSYANNGMESLSTTGNAFVKYQDAEVMLQKVDGAPVKALDVISYNNSTLLLSADLMDINLDPQPQEVSVDENSLISGLIPDVDTSKYEYFIITKPNYGTLSGDITNLSYQANNNYNGQDQFTYRVYDKVRNYSVVKTVIVKVKDANNIPKAQDRFYAFEKNVTGQYVYFQGSDVEGSSISYHVQTPPQHATLSGCVSSYCMLAAETDYVGLDSFTYRTFDGTAYSQPATVTLDFRNNRKVYYDSYLLSFEIPKNANQYTVSLPEGKVPNYTSQSYLVLETTPDIIREIDNTISFKQNGEVVATVNNCFMISPPSSYSSARDCNFRIRKPFTGTLSFRFRGINPTDPTNVNFYSDYVQVDLTIGAGGNTLYALGAVDGNIYTSPMGHFETASLEYRIRGGSLGNAQVSNIQSKEVYPVPVTYYNNVFYNISKLTSTDYGICWENNGVKDIYCLTNNNSSNQFGSMAISHQNPSGPVQRIYYANGDEVKNVQKMVLGSHQSCAITAENKAICWGNTQPTSVSPTSTDYTGCGFASSVTARGRACYLVNNSNADYENIVDISTGSNTQGGCFIREENSVGKVYCWGQDPSGSGAVFDTARAITAFNTKSAVKVSVGENYTCVAYNDNTLKCMGSNSYGRLGINNTSGSNYNTPQDVSFFEADGTTPVGIKPHTLMTRNYWACAQDTNDKVQCWGYGQAGQFGVTNTYSYKPRIMAPNEQVSSFTMSNNALCLTNAQKEVRCLGDNTYAQLGNPRTWYEYDYSSELNNYNWVAASEMRPIKEYLNKTVVKAEQVQLVNNNAYLLVSADNAFEVPVLDVQEIVQEVAENSPFIFTLGNTDNTYYIFKRPDYGFITGDSAQTLVYTTFDTTNTSVIDYLTFLIKDMFGNSVVKKYIFKVSQQQDKPVYINRNLIVYSGATVNFSHQVSDPDSNSFSYTTTQGASSGTLNCSGGSCSYVAPTRAPTAPDLIEVLHFKVTDNHGNESAVDGVVTITVKAVSNPVFDINFVSYSMYEKDPTLGLNLPTVRDPKNNIGQIAYQQNANTVKTVVHPTLGQIAMVYDKVSTNTPAGYLTGCALAANPPSVGSVACGFTPIAGYVGTARFEYIASNGSEASAVVVVEVEVKAINTLANSVFVRGNIDLSRSGYNHQVAGTEANMDYWVMPQQNEYYSGDQLTVDMKTVGNVVDMYYNPKRSTTCLRQESKVVPGSHYVTCTGFEGYVGKRSGPGYPSQYQNYNYRFIPLNDEDNAYPQRNIVNFQLGYSQACAVVSPNNELICWGETQDYGNSQSTPRSSGCGFAHSITKANIPCGVVAPDETKIENVVDLGLGVYDRCVVVDNNGVGKLLCWGFDNFGGVNGEPVGAGAAWSNERNFASPIPGTENMNIREVEAGSTFACAETATGSVVCWGQNKNGQLGRNTIDQVSPYNSLTYAPLEISVMDSGSPVVVKPHTLAVSEQTACVIGENHKLYCWGYAYTNGFYTDGASNKLIPTKITFGQDYDFKKVMFGESSSMCGILTSDEVVCWGYNPYQHLGPTSFNDTSSYISRAAAQKMPDAITGLPLKVKSFIMPYYNSMFIRK